jgi:hypothetical protein
MAHGLTGLDHVLVGVKDLAAARAAWARLGFNPAPLGRHVGRPTANHCLMFPNDYVELIGLLPGAEQASRLTRLLAERGEGAIGAAFAATSPEAAHEGFARAGLSPAPIAELRRPDPDGREMRFRLVELPAEATPDLRLFVCHHDTPELVRRPEWLEHPNGAVGLRSLTVVVDDPEARQPGLERLLGAGATAATDDVVTAFIGRHRLRFVTEEDLAFLHPELDLAPGPVPRGAALSIEVRSLDHAAELLERNGVAFAEAGDALLIPPEEATGVLLSLVQG